MSGHSKWATIKRQKGAADAKRGQIFTKLASAIALAVRQGGGMGDPTQNFKLRLAIDKARSLNMPKDNIDRAIERSMGKGGKGGGLEETVYEGFAPGGVAVIVEAATDNKLRTNSEVKSLFDKNGGTMGNPGAVSYQFQQKGQILLKKSDLSGKTIDDIFFIGADAGAEDIEDEGEEILVFTTPQDLGKVRDALVSEGVSVAEFELTRKSMTIVHVTDKEIAQKVFGFLEKLESHDDVQKVYANFDISEALLT